MFFLLPASALFAQSGMIAGILTDEDNNPIPRTTLVISKAGTAIKIHSDDDGLFYSQLLHSDLYRLDVIIDGKILKAGKVYIPFQRKKKEFYYLKVVGNKVQMRVDGKDPFMGTRVSKIKQSDPYQYYDIDARSHFMRLDMQGELVPAVGPPVPMRHLE
ncbi:MAG: hypothetical protein K0Q79_2908 [Flavipsychrobacter sp.]|nr:hypothetical protein [Flavipsychrobacter sp.]